MERVSNKVYASPTYIYIFQAVASL